jgi:uncharacterized protein
VPGESDSDPKRELQTEQAPFAGSDQHSAAPSGNLRPWGRPERGRLLIWIGIAFLAPVPAVLMLRLPVKLAGSVITMQGELPVRAIRAFLVLLATCIVARMEKRPLDDYGIPPRQAFGRRFWEGFIWGFGMLSVVLLVLRVLGHFRIDSVALTGGAILRYALGWALVFLVLAINEEFAYRGYLLFSFSRRMRFWRAATMLSFMFGAAHLGNPGENVLGILHVVLTGIVFCLTIRRTGNLWFAVGYHAAWDWAETFFYGTPNSGLLGVGRFLNTSVRGPNWLTGGSAGPEGSIIAILALLLLALLIHFRFPKTIYPDRPI